MLAQIFRTIITGEELLGFGKAGGLRVQDIARYKKIYIHYLRGERNFIGRLWPMVLNYIEAALCRAKYEILEDDGTFYGEIPDCRGVYAYADTLEGGRNELREVLEEWILFRVYKNLSLPEIDGIKLSIREVA